MNEDKGKLEVMRPNSGQLAPLNMDDPLQAVGAMMQHVLQGNITEQNVAALEKLTGLMERFDAKRSEKLFNEAFVRLQQKLPKIQANKPVTNSKEKGGGLRYYFAPYEDIMDKLQPFLIEEGFTVSFSQQFQAEGNRIIVKCTIRHTAGHSVTNECSIRVSKPPGANESQGDGSTTTYAKRFALCDAFNIVIGKDTDGGQDDDARVEGDVISAEEARELRARVRAIKSDEYKFLELAQVPVSDGANEEEIANAYTTIRRGIMPVLNSLLATKEATKKK